MYRLQPNLILNHAVVIPIAEWLFLSALKIPALPSMIPEFATGLQMNLAVSEAIKCRKICGACIDFSEPMKVSG